MTGSYTEPDEFQPNLSFIVLYPPLYMKVSQDDI